MTEQEQRALDIAKMARACAYVPISGFRVGAAVMAEDGTIYKGCNIENSCLSVTNCAERTAIFSAIAGGARKLLLLCVVADTERPVPPCGACRHVIEEFGVEKIICANMDGAIKEYTRRELLPDAFAISDIRC